MSIVCVVTIVRASARALLSTFISFNWCFLSSIFGAFLFRLPLMNTKILAFLLVIGLAATCLVNAQSPSPTASPSPAKHKSHKKAEASATASPAAASEASPSPAEKRTHKTKTAAATSPLAATTTEASPSPTEKHGRKTKGTAAASPTVAPSPSPAKKTLADFFKPKTSASPSTSTAPVTTSAGAKAETATKATQAPGGGPGLVWANTETHVYHKEGSRFYGKTQKGKYVSEADAIKEGDRSAKKE